MPAHKSIDFLLLRTRQRKLIIQSDSRLNFFIVVITQRAFSINLSDLICQIELTVQYDVHEYASWRCI